MPTKTKLLKFIFFASILFVSEACSEKMPIVNRLSSKDELPTISIENLKTTYTEQGLTKGKLQAQLAQQYDGIVEPYVDFKKGISIVLYNKENQIETSMIADRAIFYQTKKTWEATGNVVITNINGDVLRTQKLYGDDKEKKIFTNDYVQITKGDGTTLNGKDGFESNTEFTIYKFFDVSGQIFFREEFTADDDIESEPVTINSPQNTTQKEKKVRKPEFKKAEFLKKKRPELKE